MNILWTLCVNMSEMLFCASKSGSYFLKSGGAFYVENHFYV